MDDKGAQYSHFRRPIFFNQGTEQCTNSGHGVVRVGHHEQLAASSPPKQLPRQSQHYNSLSPMATFSRREPYPWVGFLNGRKDFTKAGCTTKNDEGFSTHGNPYCRFHTKSLKRRPPFEQDDILTPRRKQLITEEKMAASMESLSLESNQNVRPMKQLNDDSDFEDDSDIDDEEIEEQSIDPVFELNIDLRENIKKLTAILPESIVENMTKCDQTSLAIVPYVPREEMLFTPLRSPQLKTTRRIENSEENFSEEDLSDNMEADNEMSVMSWDSDSDQPYRL